MTKITYYVIIMSCLLATSSLKANSTKYVVNKENAEVLNFDAGKLTNQYTPYNLDAGKLYIKKVGDNLEVSFPCIYKSKYISLRGKVKSLMIKGGLVYVEFTPEGGEGETTADKTTFVLICKMKKDDEKSFKKFRTS